MLVTVAARFRIGHRVWLDALDGLVQRHFGRETAVVLPGPRPSGREFVGHRLTVVLPSRLRGRTPQWRGPSVVKSQQVVYDVIVIRRYRIRR